MQDTIRAYDAETLVIGGGRQEDAARVSQTFRLSFPVLADPDRRVYERYEMHKALFVIQRSGIVLVDKDGIVRYVNRAINPNDSLDPEELRRELQALP